MSFGPDRKHEKELLHHGMRDEQATAVKERHPGEDKLGQHPLRSGWQRLRRHIDERETLATLRDSRAEMSPALSGRGGVGAYPVQRVPALMS